MRVKRRVGGTRAPSALLSTKRAALILSGGAAKRGIGGPPMNHWPPANATVAIHLALCVVAALTLFLSSCVAPDKTHHIVVSARDQKLVLLEHGQVLAVYPVSTSKFGLGDAGGTYRTPLGQMEVAQKIGDGAPLGAVFKDRRRTGEVIPVNAPGRDPIVTRIMWLRGMQAQNRNSFGRDIYIHGTPEERNIGRPASYGCIRMRSNDIINLYEIVGPGAAGTLGNSSLESGLPGLIAASSVRQANRAGMVIR